MQGCSGDVYGCVWSDPGLEDFLVTFGLLEMCSQPGKLSSITSTQGILVILHTFLYGIDDRMWYYNYSISITKDLNDISSKNEIF